jgi:hypothetical protein
MLLFQKHLNINKILIVLLILMLLLKFLFLYFAFSISGVESIIIYIILIFIIYFKENFFNNFFKKLLVLSCVITLISMLLKIESYWSSNDFIFLLDITPSIFDGLKELFINLVDNAPKNPKTYGPEVKPALVQMWLDGSYRELAQNIGDGSTKSMSVAGFMLGCKPALAGSKTGKLIVASSSLVPFIDHIFK